MIRTIGTLVTTAYVIGSIYGLFYLAAKYEDKLYTGWWAFPTFLLSIVAGFLVVVFGGALLWVLIVDYPEHRKSNRYYDGNGSRA